MTGGEVLRDGPHQQAEDRTGWTSHLPLERGEVTAEETRSAFDSLDSIQLQFNAM